MQPLAFSIFASLVFFHHKQVLLLALKKNGHLAATLESSSHQEQDFLLLDVLSCFFPDYSLTRKLLYNERIQD
jgi:hypothetical protein